MLSFHNFTSTHSMSLPDQQDGWTTLMLAGQKVHKDVIQMLMPSGVNNHHQEGA